MVPECPSTSGSEPTPGRDETRPVVPDEAGSPSPSASIDRRQALRLGAAACLTALAGCSQSAPGETPGSTPTESTTTPDSSTGLEQLTPWTMPTGSPERTRTTPDRAPTGSLSTHWTLTPDGYRTSVVSPVVVSTAGVFGYTQTALLGASPQDGTSLFARDYELDGPLFLADGDLILTPASEPQILNLNAADGTRASLSQLPGERSYSQLQAFPVENTVIYTARLETDDPDSDGYELGAFDLASQQRLWHHRTADDGGVTVYTSPVVDTEAGILYVARINQTQADRIDPDAPQYLQAYRLSDGEKQWEREEFAVPRAVHGDRLIAVLPQRQTVLTDQYAGGLVAINTTDQTETWRQERRNDPYRLQRGGIAGDESRLYLAHDNELRALDPASGESLWTYSTTSAVVTPPVAAANALVVGDETRIHVVGKSDGSQRTSLEIGGDLTGELAVAGNRIFAGTGQGLAAFGPTSAAPTTSD